MGPRGSPSADGGAATGAEGLDAGCDGKVDGAWGATATSVVGAGANPGGGVHNWPQVGHGSGVDATDAPHAVQNRAPSTLGVPHDPQKPGTVTPPRRLRSDCPG